MEQLAKNLSTLRGAKKLSREKVSRVLELSAKTYERYEKNERDPTAPTLVKQRRFLHQRDSTKS